MFLVAWRGTIAGTAGLTAGRVLECAIGRVNPRRRVSPPQTTTWSRHESKARSGELACKRSGTQLLLQQFANHGIELEHGPKGVRHLVRLPVNSQLESNEYLGIGH